MYVLSGHILSFPTHFSNFSVKNNIKEVYHYHIFRHISIILIFLSNIIHQILLILLGWLQNKVLPNCNLKEHSPLLDQTCNYKIT